MFTRLIESYKKDGLKALAVFHESREVYTEEASQEEFNKEIEKAQDKATGKIRNKRVADPAAQAVEVLPKSEGLGESKVELTEKKDDGDDGDEESSKPMTKAEKAKKEKIFKKLKFKDFEDRYGGDAKNVMHAVATKQARK